MLRLEVTYSNNGNGRWFELRVGDEVLESVRVAEKIGLAEDKISYLIERADYPLLDEWMKKNYYKQSLVLLTHFPEVKEIPYRGFIHEKQPTVEFEDVPDYAG